MITPLDLTKVISQFPQGKQQFIVIGDADFDTYTSKLSSTFVEE